MTRWCSALKGMSTEQWCTTLCCHRTIIYSTLTPYSNHMGNNYMQHADALLRREIYREQSYILLWHPTTIIYSTLTPCSNHIGNNHTQLCCVYGTIIYSCVVYREQSYIGNNHTQQCWRTAPMGTFREQSYTILRHPTTMIYNTLTPYNNHIQHSDTLLKSYREQSYATRWRTAPTGNYPENNGIRE